MPKRPFRLFIVLVVFLTSNGLASAQSYETKDQWSEKISADKRISNALCGEQSYLLTCTSEYTDQEDGKTVVKKIEQADCAEATDYLVKSFLHNGKSDGKPAMFYLKLPTNIGAGYQMNYFAGELAKQVFAQISGLLQQKGGALVQSPECNQKLLETFSIDGN